MQIRARMSMSADGYVTTPEGWPALTADPAFGSGQSHGIQEFFADCEAALMGRTTFAPALTNERWPWPSLDVFILASHRPEGTPDHVVTESDPARLLERIRAANGGGTSTSSAGRARSRRFARSERSTPSSWSWSRCSSAGGCS
jgi:dihydrofolate reductase